MEIDFLLIGQGLAGTALGYRLKQAGKKIRLYDLPGQNLSSRIAAGLFNPVTGRKMVKTWNADRLFPEIIPFYRELEDLTGVGFLNEETIYRPFMSIEEQNEWMGNSSDPAFGSYLKEIVQKSQSPSLNDPFGGVMLRNSGWLNINPMLDAMAMYFGEELVCEGFDEEELQFKDGVWDYKGVRSRAVIYCNGTAAKQSRFFGFLPFAPVKGEVLEVKQEFCPDYIVNRGVFRIHLGEGVHRIGSTYTWHDLDQGPTESAKKELLVRLSGLIQLPVKEVVSHKSGIRPATRDRKPFLGKHPKEQSVYIFDGFGAKGVSLIPFYSKMMLKFLTESKPVDEEVSITRYFNYL